MTLIRWLDQRFYPDQSGHWDDQLLRQRVERHLRAKRGPVILDVGAGAGIVPQMNLKPLAARTCGIDLDPRVASNPFLDEGVVGSAEDIPYPSELFDLVLANNVLEHLESPERVLAEVYRVLKPGGLFIAKTPNKYHYVPLIASLTPHRFHAWVNSLRGRGPEDTFPTRYLANRPSVLRRMGEGAGFAEVVIQMVEGRPEYLRWNAACYLAGICYERLVNSLAPLETLRVVLIAEFAKGHPQMLRHGSGARGLN